MTEKSIPKTREDFLAQNPHLTDFMKYLDRLNKESEMGAVLISASVIDEFLRRALMGRLLDVPEAQELVDGANAPLGTFSSRITAAYCLGLINKDEFDECNRIRRIRNEFAHDMETTFETQSVKDKCYNLKLAAMPYTKEDGTEVLVDARGRFTTASLSVVGRLNNRAFHSAANRLAWINPPN